MESQTKLWISIEWLATATLIIGVALTSWNIYPANIYISGLGNLLWFLVALHWKKKSLIVIQVFILGLYIMGMGKHIMEGL
jgi:hypothetical protein